MGGQSVVVIIREECTIKLLYYHRTFLPFLAPLIFLMPVCYTVHVTYMYIFCVIFLTFNKSGSQYSPLPLVTALVIALVVVVVVVVIVVVVVVVVVV